MGCSAERRKKPRIIIEWPYGPIRCVFFRSDFCEYNSSFFFREVSNAQCLTDTKSFFSTWELIQISLSEALLNVPTYLFLGSKCFH
jgi:hypothetical protein